MSYARVGGTDRTNDDVVPTTTTSANNKNNPVVAADNARHQQHFLELVEFPTPDNNNHNNDDHSKFKRCKRKRPLTTTTTSPPQQQQQRVTTYEQLPTEATSTNASITASNKSVGEDGSVETISDDDVFQDEFFSLPTKNKNESNNNNNDNNTSSSSSSKQLADYWRVMLTYPMYRSYFWSLVCQNMGDWFVRIASILVVQELNSSGKTLSHLAVAIYLPKAVFAQVGGLVSDRYDRRQNMIALDMLSAIVVLGILVAIHYRSLTWIYIITMMRSSLEATYVPITNAIVPLLVPNVQDLQLAVTMNTWAWGMTSVVGGLVAGSISAVIGLSACYIVDSVTFLLSAAFMYWGVSGNYSVATPATATTTPAMEASRNNSSSPCCAETYTAFSQLASYLWTCGFGLLVLSEASASLVWGIEDVIGAEFSTVFDADTGEENEEASSLRTGLLFSVIGTGCMVGPVVLNTITDPQRPYTVQRAILIGLCGLTAGWFMIATVRQSFAAFLMGTFVRTMGSGMAWINSILLLQTLCDPQILGRVLAVNYTFTTLLEASSAAISGNLADAGYSKNQLALFGALLGVGVVLFWGVYYSLSLGAAHPRFNDKAVAAIVTSDTGNPDPTTIRSATPEEERGDCQPQEATVGDATSATEKLDL